MNEVGQVVRIPKSVWQLPLGERIVWARKRSKLSHDRIVVRMGRSNRSHLIKIEKGIVPSPTQELRDALADALEVPRELFADSQEPRAAAPFHGAGDDTVGSADGRGSGRSARRGRSGSRGADVGEAA